LGTTYFVLVLLVASPLAPLAAKAAIGGGTAPILPF